jgi:hypothetical protein
MNTIKALALTATLLFLFFSDAKACTCNDLSEYVNSKNLFALADYVIIGKAFTSNHPNPGRMLFLNMYQQSPNVLFLVDFVLKGDITIGESVFIYEDFGDCVRTFVFSESYLVFGFRINEVKAVNSQNFIGESLHNGVLSIEASSEPSQWLNFLKTETKKYTTLQTSTCASMHVDSYYFDKTIKALGKL